jgi:hypothetical protein
VVADGLSSADLRRAAAPEILQRNGAVRVKDADPVDDALAMAKKVTAAKLIQQQATSMETEALKAENEKLKVEIEHKQLLESQRPVPGDDGWRDYLLTQMDRLQGQLAETQREAQTAQRALLEERMAMLQGELERIRSQSTPPPPPSAGERFQTIKAEIQAAREVLAEVQAPEKPVVPVIDLEWKKFELITEERRELQRLEFEERRRQLEVEIALKREAAEREQARLDKEEEMKERFVNQTLPQLLEQGQKWYNLLAQRWGLGAPASPASPTAAPMQAPRQPPPGVEAMTCQSCGQVLYYVAGAPSAVCPYCFAVYGESTAPESPASAEVVRETNLSAVGEE